MGATVSCGHGGSAGVRYDRNYIVGEWSFERNVFYFDGREIAMQAMKGAVATLESSGMHPAVAIDKVTTPGGLTIKGLNELDHAGFNSAVIRCLKAGLAK